MLITTCIVCCCVCGGLVLLSVLKDTCICSDRPLKEEEERDDGEDDDDEARAYDDDVLEGGGYAGEALEPVASRLDRASTSYDIAREERKLLRLRGHAAASDARLAEFAEYGVISDRQRGLHSAARLSSSAPPPLPPQHVELSEYYYKEDAPHAEGWGAPAAEWGGAQSWGAVGGAGERAPLVSRARGGDAVQPWSGVAAARGAVTADEYTYPHDAPHYGYTAEEQYAWEQEQEQAALVQGHGDGGWDAYEEGAADNGSAWEAGEGDSTTAAYAYS